MSMEDILVALDKKVEPHFGGKSKRLQKALYKYALVSSILSMPSAVVGASFTGALTYLHMKGDTEASEEYIRGRRAVRFGSLVSVPLGIAFTAGLYSMDNDIAHFAAHQFGIYCSALLSYATAEYMEDLEVEPIDEEESLF